MIAGIDLIDRSIERTHQRINELRAERKNTKVARDQEIQVLRLLQLAKLRKLEPGAKRRAEIVNHADLKRKLANGEANAH